MARSWCIGQAGLVLLLWSGTCAAQTVRELPAEARERLEHAIGRWSVVTRYYDRDGKVAREVNGVDTNRYVIPGRVIEHTSETAGRDRKVKGQMFYNMRADEFCMTSVDASGDLWILSGGLDEYVLTSRPRKRPDGSELIVRFRHEKIQPDSFEAQLETSIDGGKTWRSGSRQFLTRMRETGSGAAQVAPPSLATMAVRVHHLDKMVSFYTEAFGFSFREVDTQGIKSQFGTLGTLTLKFVPIRAETDFVDYPSHQPGFVVDDVEAVVGLARKYGGRVEGELQRDGELVTSGAVRDPDGNTIELYRREGSGD